MVRRRILYLMHVDWHWIKQRPHFLAESVARSHSVLVLYLPLPHRHLLSRNPRTVRRLPLLCVPGRLGRAVERLATALQKIWILLVSRAFRPDLVWVTHPSLYGYLPQSVANLPLIYDCMDDELAFPAREKRAGAIAATEGKLIQAATWVLCASACLRDRLVARYRIADETKLVLLRNGFAEHLIPHAVGPGEPGRLRSTARQPFRTGLDVAYIGTVSAWVDFDSVDYCLQAIPDLRFHMVGPAEIARRHLSTKSERLVFHGAVPHSALPDYVRRFDAFALPFLVTRLTEAVDPVKLYEYLAFGKEVLAVYYAEIERFRPFCHFYQSREELCDLLRRLQNGALEPKARSQSVRTFLLENTWARRGEIIQTLLSSLGPQREA